MKEYSRFLGDAVKRARGASGLTQREVADKMNKDVRTVLNIENYKGNPKLEVLYPLVRALNIDPREVFYPNMQQESPAIRQLRLLVDDCSEESHCFDSRTTICASRDPLKRRNGDQIK